MSRMVVTWIVFLLAFGSTLAFVGGCAQEQGLPKLIPRDVVFGNPEKARATISPDGKMLAYLAPVGDVLNVWVKTIGKDDDRPVTSSSSFRENSFMREGGEIKQSYLNSCLQTRCYNVVLICWFEGNPFLPSAP